MQQVLWQVDFQHGMSSLAGQAVKRWKLPVLGVSFSYHSQTMLPVVWKERSL